MGHKITVEYEFSPDQFSAWHKMLQSEGEYIRVPAMGLTQSHPEASIHWYSGPNHRNTIFNDGRRLVEIRNYDRNNWVVSYDSDGENSEEVDWSELL